MSPKRGSTVLVTLLFTDIVGSTEIAAEMGDRRWRDLVQRHHAAVRRELKRFGGKELDTAGDGFFASFDRPAEAIRCACAISDEVRELGLEIRAGLHLGEAEVLENKVGGIAVNVGARVMGVAKGGEVLASSTLRDAVSGSGFAFADHGSHRLKGIDGEWRLYEVTAVDGVRRSLPLSQEESRTRREFAEAVPGPPTPRLGHRGRDRHPGRRGSRRSDADGWDGWERNRPSPVQPRRNVHCGRSCPRPSDRPAHGRPHRPRTPPHRWTACRMSSTR